MEYFDQVKEEKYDGLRFFVTHRLFNVPKNVFHAHVSEDHPELTQETAQQFVSDYLAWQKDHGVVGLVRFRDEGDHVLLKAAVRYLVDDDKTSPDLP